MYKVLCTALLAFLANSLTAQIYPKATSGNDRIKSLQQKKLMQQQSVYNQTAFENIGPSIMSGRVVDVEANPQSPTEFYVAYASGGVWHTTNNGMSFTPIFDSNQVLIIGDIAVNWSTQNRQIWVGTGEVNSSRSSYAGTGIYKTTDHGKTWDYLGLPESHHIGKIQLHPTDSNTAWVAVLGHLYTNNKERGVYKTTNAGISWKQQLFVNDSTGCVDIDINPNNPNELYAAMWQKQRKAWQFVESGASSGIYKSYNGGNTWQLITTPTSGFMQGNKIGRIGVAVASNKPNIVYAVVDNNMPKEEEQKKQTTTNSLDSNYKVEMFKTITPEAFDALNDKWLDSFLIKNDLPQKYNANTVKQLVKTNAISPKAIYDYLNTDDGFKNTNIKGCQVYKSENGGASWQLTHDKPISIYSTYGYYFGKIYISPTNENKIYILGFNSMVSTNAGKDFKLMDKDNVHADHHALWVNPANDNHLINGNDGGCNITYDNGNNWFKANAPAVAQYYAITTDEATPYNIYGGLQDNGVWRVSSKKNKNSLANSGLGLDENKDMLIGGGDGMQVQIDTRNNATVYYGSQFGYYARKNISCQGKTQPTVTIMPQHNLGEPALRFNWQTPIVLSKHQQDVLYYGANKFYRSLNQGDSLIAMSNDLTKKPKTVNVPYGTITCISESPLQFGLIYVGTDDGNLHISKDGGYHFTSLLLPNNINNNLWVSRVTASAHQLGTVYVTLNGYRFDHFTPYVLMSTDYGVTWQNISSNLPLESVNVIKEHPSLANYLLVGTDGGLYISNNYGQQWQAWNAGLPNSVPVHDIAIHKRENEIIIATHGRSLYKAKLNVK